MGPSKGRVLGAFRSDFGSISVSRGDFGIIVELLWVYEGPFSKNIHFHPIDLSDFIKQSGRFWTALGPLWC